MVTTSALSPSAGAARSPHSTTATASSSTSSARARSATSAGEPVRYTSAWIRVPTGLLVPQR